MISDHFQTYFIPAKTLPPTVHPAPFYFSLLPFYHPAHRWIPALRSGPETPALNKLTVAFDNV